MCSYYLVICTCLNPPYIVRVSLLEGKWEVGIQL